MSDDVHLVLIEGVAAVKSGRPERRQEARVRLEEVLQRTDAEPDQKAEAWLWLSRIEQDPRKKRLCLESVLALDPANGSAHQGLAILDGRLRASDVMDPHEAVPPLEPPETPPATGVHRSVCPKCGGKVSFETGRRSLVCSYCGTQFPPPQAAVQNPVVQEQDFFSALPTAKAHRWELPTERTLKCQGCGAAFTLPPLQISGMCPFCESAAVVTSSGRELIEPTAVLPFQISRQEAEAQIRTWITRRRFRPGDLEARAEISAPRGVFLPFWTFDLGGTMSLACPGCRETRAHHPMGSARRLTSRLS